MPPISLSPFASVDDAAYARRKALRHRMRIVACGSVILFAGLGALSFQAYVEHGLLIAIGLFIVGSVFLIEAVRQADKRFVAPLQALCQYEYGREVELALGPLLDATPRDAVAASRSDPLARRVDA